MKWQNNVLLKNNSSFLSLNRGSALFMAFKCCGLLCDFYFGFGVFMLKSSWQKRMMTYLWWMFHHMFATLFFRERDKIIQLGSIYNIRYHFVMNQTCLFFPTIGTPKVVNCEKPHIRYKADNICWNVLNILENSWQVRNLWA